MTTTTKKPRRRVLSLDDKIRIIDDFILNVPLSNVNHLVVRKAAIGYTPDQELFKKALLCRDRVSGLPHNFNMQLIVEWWWHSHSKFSSPVFARWFRSIVDADRTEEWMPAPPSHLARVMGITVFELKNYVESHYLKGGFGIKQPPKTIDWAK